MRILVCLLLIFSCKEESLDSVKYQKFTDHRGNLFQLANLKGKKSIFYFGYSHCPDMCPLALDSLSKALTELKEKETYVIFVSLDPLRDNPIRMSGYISRLRNDSLIGITGQPSDIEKLAIVFGVQSKRKDEKSTYYLDHTNQLIFMNENLIIEKRVPGNLSFESLKLELSKL